MRTINGIVVGTDVTDDISSRILSMAVSLTTDMASQITMTVADPGLRMMRANYFQIRQQITYLNQKWEIASVEVRQGRAGEEIILECRLQAVQKLKRDKGGRTFKEGTPTAFAAARAREVGLGFFGESTAAKGKILRVRNDTTDESTWDVLVRLAGDNQFWCFESDGRLFFTSQHFLLGKFALMNSDTNPGFLSTRIDWRANGRVVQEDTQPVLYQSEEPIPAPGPLRPFISAGAKGVYVKYLQQVLRLAAGQNVTVNSNFDAATQTAVNNLQAFFGFAEGGTVGAQTWAIIDLLASGLRVVGGVSSTQYTIVPLEVPTVRKSDDAPEAMSFSAKIEREVGRDLRPGMTVFVDGVPGFYANCLVTEVSWNEGTTEPVSVSGRTTETPSSFKERRRALRKIDATGGGFNTVESQGIL